MPAPVSTSWTRSWSPTDAPPSVTMTSAPASMALRDQRRDGVQAVRRDAEVEHVARRPAAAIAATP